MSKRFSIALLLSGMVGSVLFGAGVVTVLLVPSLSDQAPVLLPVVVALSLVIAPVISWAIAPMLRAKHSRDVEALHMLTNKSVAAQA
jgi:hypothetical protein